MSYSIQPGDIIEVRLNMLMNGQRLMNVCHFRNGENEILDAQAAMQDSLDDMFEGIEPTVAGGYLGLLSEDLLLDYADMQVIYPLRRAYERKIINQECGNTGTALPQNVQASITKRSTFSGPGAEGSIRIPGLVSEQVTAGRLGPSAIEDLTTIAAGWMTPLDLGTYDAAAPPIIYHRANPNISVRWETLTIQPEVRVSRRRTVGLGQ